MHNVAPVSRRGAEIFAEKHRASAILRSALQEFSVTCVIFVILAPSRGFFLIFFLRRGPRIHTTNMYCETQSSAPARDLFNSMPPIPGSQGRKRRGRIDISKADPSGRGHLVTSNDSRHCIGLNAADPEARSPAYTGLRWRHVRPCPRRLPRDLYFLGARSTLIIYVR